jgi:DNA repair protein RecO (recombination protein O)
VKAIVLRRRNVGEADRLLTLFTDEKGKVVARAKSVRIPTAKQGGKLEPFYVIDPYLVGSRAVQILASAEIVETFPKIHTDLSKWGTATLFAEMTDTLTGEHEKHTAVFDLLLEALRLTESRVVPPIATSAFEIKLVSALGYQPELDKCVVGEENISQKMTYVSFSIELGGIICSDHAERYQGKKISWGTVVALRKMIEQDLSKTAKMALTKQVSDEVKSLIFDFLRYHVAPKLKSPKVLESLLAHS